MLAYLGYVQGQQCTVLHKQHPSMLGFACTVLYSLVGNAWELWD